MIDGIIFVFLAVYAALWCKFKLKRKMFEPIPIHEVMAMENPMYLFTHKRYNKEHKNKKNESKNGIKEMPERV